MSERLLILEKLFEHGLAVFDGQRDVFQTWLQTPLAELATSETGFPSPKTSFAPKPVDQMGTKQGPVDLAPAAAARRERLASSPDTASPAYPTPLSLLDTMTGCKLVDNVFTRIEAGVFS